MKPLSIKELEDAWQELIEASRIHPINQASTSASSETYGDGFILYDPNDIIPQPVSGRDDVVTEELELEKVHEQVNVKCDRCAVETTASILTKYNGYFVCQECFEEIS